MTWSADGCKPSVGAIALAFAGSLLAAVPAGARPTFPQMQGEGALLYKAADYGISMVRMPPRPGTGGQSTTPTSQETPPVRPKDPPKQPPQPQGRLIKLTARMGSQPTDGLKGWLGVNMEAVELPLALSLGLVNGDGALILGTLVGSPAAQAGLRFGDIVVGLNGRAVRDMNDLRQQVMQASPGSDAALEVWRVATDENDFVQTLRRLADGGNAHVMYRLGRFYAGGNGVPRDDTQAVQWYRKGSDAGNLSAMTALAGALLDGRGTGIDQQEALRLLRTAAAGSHAEAMNRLGNILHEGRITQKDALEAARLFTKAAEAGHVPSMVDLARMYYNGDGMQTDLTKAALWYKQAADLGSAPGMVGLGWLYEHGKGVETDVGKAAMLYRRAADLGNSVAMVDLGLLYVQGKGVDKNEFTAVSLYRKAIALNNSMAMNNLAWMLQAGRGVERKDPEEAAELMMKALDRRNEFSRQRMTQYSNTWSREFRQALQRRLQEAGFYTGRIDGEFRQSTIAAIDAYFNRNR